MDYNAWESRHDCGTHIDSICGRGFVLAETAGIGGFDFRGLVAGWPAGAGLMIHILGFLGQQPRISMIALFLGLYG